MGRGHFGLASWADGIGPEARFGLPIAITTDLQKLYVGDNCSQRTDDTSAGSSDQRGHYHGGCKRPVDLPISRRTGRWAQLPASIIFDNTHKDLLFVDIEEGLLLRLR